MGYMGYDGLGVSTWVIGVAEGLGPYADVLGLLGVWGFT